MNMRNEQLHAARTGFYQFYLSQHRNRTSRRLHFIGSTLVVVLVLGATVYSAWWLLWVALIQAYVFAWVGHFFFELNRPATFHHPLKSFVSDWRMWWEMLTGKIPF